MPSTTPRPDDSSQPEAALRLEPGSPHGDEHEEPGTYLPTSLTRFVGRDRDIDAVHGLLARHDVRLVTLTGPGGIGKTRLALRVAETSGSFPDGIWFVDLAPLYEPGAVGPAIGRALDVRAAGDEPVEHAIEAFLRHRRALLILDNFEQVPAAATLVTELLLTCPTLTVLVTSRAALRIEGEHRFDLPPLDLPEDGRGLSPQRLMEFDAVQLFVDRARLIAAGFALTDANANDVAAICARLDGMPLAIELAAARTNLLSPADMRHRLEGRLPLLGEGPRGAPDRLRTMRDSIAWSHDLLGPRQRALFRQLGSLVGTWTLDAAEAVAGATDSVSRQGVFESLAALVDASLVRKRPETETETVYRMLVPIREFAEDLLERSDESHAVGLRHLAFITDLVEQAEVALFHPDGERRIARLRIHGANIRKAIDWAERHGHVEEMIRLAGTLNVYGSGHFRVQEARLLAQQAAAVGRTLASPQLAKTLASLAADAYVMGDQIAARASCDEALAVIDDNTGVYTRYTAHAWDGVLALRDGEFDRAIAAQRTALAVLRAAPESEVDWTARAESTTLSHLGNIAVGAGDIDGAERWFEQALDRQQEIGCAPGTSHIIANHPIAGLGDVARARGDVRLALRRYQEALSLASRFGDHVRTGYILGGVAATLAAAGRWQLASRLFGGTQAYHERIGLHFERETMDRQRALGLPEPWLRGNEPFGTGQALRDALWADRPVPPPGIPDPARAAALWEAGRALPFEKVLAEALAADVDSPTPVDALPFGLSTREAEVLRELVAGKSDAEIGDTLYISRRTVSAHMQHIYHKLGVSSRAEAAALAVRHGLA